MEQRAIAAPPMVAEPPPQQEQDGAESIIEQMNRTLEEVHDYAFQKLTELEKKIGQIKASIVMQKNRSQQETQIYIETVDTALRTAQELDRLVDDVSRTLPKPKTNGVEKLDNTGVLKKMEL